jgi:hypothetical protein
MIAATLSNLLFFSLLAEGLLRPDWLRGRAPRGAAGARVAGRSAGGVANLLLYYAGSFTI